MATSSTCSDANNSQCSDNDRDKDKNKHDRHDRHEARGDAPGHDDQQQSLVDLADPQATRDFHNLMKLATATIRNDVLPALSLTDNSANRRNGHAVEGGMPLDQHRSAGSPPGGRLDSASVNDIADRLHKELGMTDSLPGWARDQFSHQTARDIQNALQPLSEQDRRAVEAAYNQLRRCTQIRKTARPRFWT
jgi:hypothetical protein